MIKKPTMNSNEQTVETYPSVVYAKIIGISDTYSKDYSWKNRDKKPDIQI